MRLLAQAGQMPASRALIRQPSHGHLKIKKEAEHNAEYWVLLKMDISLDDRSLQRPVQGRTAAEFQRLKEGDKLRRLAQDGQMPAARALIRQPSHGHLEIKKEAEHNAGYWVLLKMDISLDDRSLQRPVQGRTAAELQKLKEGDKLRCLAQAGQMLYARASQVMDI